MASSVLDGFKISAEVDIPGAPVRIVQRAIEALDSTPDMEVMTTRQLAAKMQRSLNYLLNFSTEPALEKYHCRMGVKLFWGNAKTIAKLKKRLAR